MADDLSGRSPRARRPFSPAEWSGFVALFLYLPLWMIDPRLAVVPLCLFVLACAIFPFSPQASFFFPVISRGRSTVSAVSLTFDDGPNPVSTPLLLRLLKDHGVVATFFVTGEHSRRHPDIIREIVAQGHSVGNHSYSHDNFIMFRGPWTLIREIEDTQEVLMELGVVPRVFRPCVGITTPGYADALHHTGLAAVNFSRRARDMGNRRIRGLARRILGPLRAGDIILLHDVPPPVPDDFQLWLAEVESVISGIQAKGMRIVPLAALIDRLVMATVAQRDQYSGSNYGSRS
jgi:peptidoglycan/xylan/chitin deacetylase (PgdA/CDA1 family)